MLFKTEFHEGIRNGGIEVTFRSWKSARAKVGNRYQFGINDSIEVDSVESIAMQMRVAFPICHHY